MWEAEKLRGSLKAGEDGLERKKLLAEKMRESKDDEAEDAAWALKMADIQVRNATKYVGWREMAYHQANVDAQRLYPGQTFTEITWRKPLDQRYSAEDFSDKEQRRLEVQRLLDRYGTWLEQAPEEATTTREAVIAKLHCYKAEADRLQKDIDHLKG